MSVENVSTKVDSAEVAKPTDSLGGAGSRGAKAQRMAAPYQVRIVVGDIGDAEVAQAVNTFHVSLDSADPSEVAQALGDAGVSAADVRSKTLLVFGQKPSDVEDYVWLVRTLVCVAALWGLSRRRPDVLFVEDEQLVDCSEVDSSFRALVDSGRPDEPVVVAAAGPVGLPAAIGAPHVSMSSKLSESEVSSLRFARRVLWTPPEDLPSAVIAATALAGLRARGELDRLPVVWDAGAQSEPDAVIPGSVVDLGAARRAGELLRATTRHDDRFAVADVVPPTDRQVWLGQMAALPIVVVLDALDARSAWVDDEETGEQTQVWHCLFPDNHTHGDATPSARVGPTPSGADGFRCMRCLAERVDSLRLVMWAKNMTPDDAAVWLSVHAAPVAVAANAGELGALSVVD